MNREPKPTPYTDDRVEPRRDEIGCSIMEVSTLPIPAYWRKPAPAPKPRKRKAEQVTTPPPRTTEGNAA